MKTYENYKPYKNNYYTFTFLTFFNDKAQTFSSLLIPLYINNKKKSIFEYKYGQKIFYTEISVFFIGPNKNFRPIFTQFYAV